MIVSRGAGRSAHSSAVATELRRMILSGELPAGTRLRQVEVAERFHVSTTPVREVFSVLARQGLVRHDVQRGVVVFTPNERDVRENYEIRIALEPLATALAAEHISDAQLARLAEIVGRMRTTSDPIEYVGLNREFHRAIYSAADRPRLFELIESLRDAFEAYIQYDARTRPDPRYFEQAHRQHEAIAAALQARRPDRARALMQEHLEQNAVHHTETVSESQADDAAAA